MRGSWVIHAQSTLNQTIVRSICAKFAPRFTRSSWCICGCTSTSANWCRCCGGPFAGMALGRHPCRVRKKGLSEHRVAPYKVLGAVTVTADERGDVRVERRQMRCFRVVQRNQGLKDAEPRECGSGAASLSARRRERSAHALLPAHVTFVDVPPASAGERAGRRMANLAKQR